jgi:hypothetical protein
VIVFLIASSVIGKLLNRTLYDFLVNSTLGFGVLSYLVFFTGFITTGIPWFSILIVVSILALIRVALQKGFRFQLQRIPEFCWFDYLIIAGISILLIGHYLLAASPMITWDAATHHYLVPLKWLEYGKITPIREIIFSEYPSTIEILYMIGYQFAGEWTANLVNWMLSLLLVMAIYKFISERYSRRSGLIGALVFITMPLSIELFTGGLIDMGYALFCFMSFWMFIDYRETGKRGNLFLSAVFAGFALGSKHLAMEYLAALFIGVLIYDLITRKKTVKSWILDFVILFGIGFLIALPWYIKSYINTGNPIHPFLPGLFNGLREVSTPISVHAWSRPDYKRSILSLLTYPWKITTDFTFFDFWIYAISPLFLGTVPLWWYFKKKFLNPSFSIIMLVIVTFIIIAYRIAPSSTRYMLPILCMITIPTAVSLNFLIDKFGRYGKATVFVILLIPFIFNLAVVSKHVNDVLPVLLGRETKDQLYLKQIDGYDSMKWINENLPENSLILTTDPKGYFLKRPFLVGTAGAQSSLLPDWSVEDSDYVLDQWHKLGVTHLLFNLSKNVMKNSYFVYAVSRGIEERGELLMTAEELADFTKLKTEYEYQPEEIAEFGRVTQTPTEIIDGKVYYHLFPEWWEYTVGRDETQYMFRHYHNLLPHFKEVARFDSAIVYEIQYD